MNLYCRVIFLCNALEDVFFGQIFTKANESLHNAMQIAFFQLVGGFPTPLPPYTYVCSKFPLAFQSHT